MSEQLPFSQAAENNKAPIAEILTDVFSDVKHVLEIGSCTGQHAVHMGRAFPDIIWQPSDIAPMIDGLGARIEKDAPDNVRPPISIDVMDGEWPFEKADAVYAANVVHIISKPHIEALFAGIGRTLTSGGILVLYGPFKYGGNYTSESNARFDLWLKNRDSKSGIRQFEYIDGLARSHQLRLQDDFQMPANNQLIVWRKD